MKQKVSSQIDSDLLQDVRAIAAEEGRQFQAVLEEALREWVARKKELSPRSEVMAQLKASIVRNRELYRRLAK